MGGLCYQTPKWPDRLWHKHIDRSESAKDRISEAGCKVREAAGKLAEDLHARLYLDEQLKPREGAPDWASQIHKAASETQQWETLRKMTANNGFAAGIATERVLESIMSQLPSLPEEDPTGYSGMEQNPKLDEGKLRQAMRRAATGARKAVQQAQEEIRGTAEALGIRQGHGTSPPGLEDPDQLRLLYSRIKDDSVLRKISELAGRIQQATEKAARSIVRRAGGEIYDVELGGSLLRLLPSEFAMLAKGRQTPAYRRLFMLRYLENRCLQYATRDRISLKRGPIAMALDISGSMKDADKHIWAKAVALTLLAQARSQHRDFAIVLFNGSVVFESGLVARGQMDSEQLLRMLSASPSGGTDFDAALVRLLDTMATASEMRKADVIMVSDGEATTSDLSRSMAQSLTKDHGVKFLAVAVGRDAGPAMVGGMSGILTHPPIVVRWMDDTITIAEHIHCSDAES